MTQWEGHCSSWLLASNTGTPSLAKQHGIGPRRKDGGQDPLQIGSLSLASPADSSITGIEWFRAKQKRAPRAPARHALLEPRSPLCIFIPTGASDAFLHIVRLAPAALAAPQRASNFVPCPARPSPPLRPPAALAATWRGTAGTSASAARSSRSGRCCSAARATGLRPTQVPTTDAGDMGRSKWQHEDLAAPLAGAPVEMCTRGTPRRCAGTTRGSCLILSCIAATTALWIHSSPTAAVGLGQYMSDHRAKAGTANNMHSVAKFEAGIAKSQRQLLLSPDSEAGVVVDDERNESGQRTCVMHRESCAGSSAADEHRRRRGSVSVGLAGGGLMSECCSTARPASRAMSG
jgi:hypothetical protein